MCKINILIEIYILNMSLFSMLVVSICSVDNCEILIFPETIVLSNRNVVYMNEWVGRVGKWKVVKRIKVYYVAPTGNRTQGKCLEGAYVTTTPQVLISMSQIITYNILFY